MRTAGPSLPCRTLKNVVPARRPGTRLLSRGARQPPDSRSACIYPGPPHLARPPLTLAARPLLPPQDPAGRRELFNTWKAENNKSYATPALENQAFAAWNAALTDVITHNQGPAIKFVKGLSEFSDTAFPDFAAKRLMKNADLARVAADNASGAAKKGAAAAKKGGRRLAQATVPAVFDWRTAGANGASWSPPCATRATAGRAGRLRALPRWRARP